ncbi:MAG: SDR family NAD(P)-dependent oxidoreductase [Methyloligellaceae bacterium]
MIKSIIITGAGSGIGRSLAIQLADQNIHVLAIGRRISALQETASHNPQKIKFLSADVSHEEELNNIHSMSENLPLPLGIFHGAGVYQINKLSEISMENWQSSFNINVTARLALTQKLLPRLPQGRVLFIGSDAAKNIRLGASTYSIAQAASQTLAEALKLELKQQNISVTAFKPGLVETDMVKTFIQAPTEIFPAVEEYKNIIATGKLSTAETVASFAKWLLLNTSDQDFSEKLWDIREEWHHKHWLKGSLYGKSDTP